MWCIQRDMAVGESEGWEFGFCVCVYAEFSGNVNKGMSTQDGHKKKRTKTKMNKCIFFCCTLDY